jgi:hypothetical protein
VLIGSVKFTFLISLHYFFVTYSVYKHKLVNHLFNYILVGILWTHFSIYLLYKASVSTVVSIVVWPFSFNAKIK